MMGVDRERRKALERERAEAQTAIERLPGAGSTAGTGAGVSHRAVTRLQERIRAIDAELERMEFAAELERQSDA